MHDAIPNYMVEHYEKDAKKDIPVKIKPCVENFAVYVKNIHKNVTESMLKTLFNQCGTVKTIKIVKNTTDSNTTFGFVHFEKLDELDYAIKKVNGYALYGCPLHVAVSRSSENIVSEKLSFQPLSYAGTPCFDELSGNAEDCKEFDNTTVPMQASSDLFSQLDKTRKTAPLKFTDVIDPDSNNIIQHNSSTCDMSNSSHSLHDMCPESSLTSINVAEEVDDVTITDTTFGKGSHVLDRLRHSNKGDISRTIINRSAVDDQVPFNVLYGLCQARSCSVLVDNFDSAMDWTVLPNTAEATSANFKIIELLTTLDWSTCDSLTLPINLGQHILVKDPTKNMRRAKRAEVLKFWPQSTLDVYLLDEGIEVQHVDMAFVRMLPKSIAQLPSSVMRCRLFGVDRASVGVATAMFQQLLNADSLHISIRVEKNLFSCTQMLSVCVPVRVYHKDSELMGSWTPSPSIAIPSRQFSQHEIFSIILPENAGHVKPTRFLGQVASPNSMKDYLDVQQCLKNADVLHRLTPMHLDTLKKGVCVLAPFEFQGETGYYRAEILTDTLTADLNRVEVQFLDDGNIESVELVLLRCIPQELAVIPRCAVWCEIQGASHLRRVQNKELDDTFLSIVRQASELQVKILSVSDAIVSVVLFCDGVDVMNKLRSLQNNNLSQLSLRTKDECAIGMQQLANNDISQPLFSQTSPCETKKQQLMTHDFHSSTKLKSPQAFADGSDNRLISLTSPCDTKKPHLPSQLMTHDIHSPAKLTGLHVSIYGNDQRIISLKSPCDTKKPHLPSQLMTHDIHSPEKLSGLHVSTHGNDQQLLCRKSLLGIGKNHLLSPLKLNDGEEIHCSTRAPAGPQISSSVGHQLSIRKLPHDWTHVQIYLPENECISLKQVALIPQSVVLSDLEKIEKLVCEQSWPNHPMPHAVMCGNVYMARYQRDRNWYRAQVVHQSEYDVLKLLFIDYGNLEVEARGKMALRILSEDLVDIPGCVIFSELLGCTNLSQECVHKLDKLLRSALVDGARLRAKFEAVEDTCIGTGLPRVNLRLESAAGNLLCDDVLDLLSEEVDLSERLRLLSKDLSASQVQPSLRVGSELVHVSYLGNDLDKFWVQRRDHSILSSYVKLLSLLENFQTTIPLQFALKNIVCGVVGLTQREKNKLWYRVEVTDVHVEKSSCSVLFIDWGATAKISFSALFQCPPELLTWKAWAQPVKLANLFPCSVASESADVEWSLATVRRVRSLLSDKACEARVLLLSRGIAEVALYTLDGQDVSQLLIEEGLALNGLSVNPAVWSHLPTEAMCRGVAQVIRTNSLDCIWLLPQSNEGRLVAMQNDLTAYYHSHRPDVASWNVGRLYAAQLSEANASASSSFGEWSRAELLDMPRDGKAFVCLIDLGDVISIESNHLCELEARFALMPQLCIPCHLEGIGVANDAPSDAVDAALQHVLHPFHVEVTPIGPTLVRLCHENGDCVTERLLYEFPTLFFSWSTIEENDALERQMKLLQAAKDYKQRLHQEAVSRAAAAALKSTSPSRKR